VSDSAGGLRGQTVRLMGGREATGPHAPHGRSPWARYSAGFTTRPMKRIAPVSRSRMT